MDVQAARIGTSGHTLTVDGSKLSDELYGVCDTTVLQFAILSYIEDQAVYRGKNQNFPGPQGTITQNGDAETLFHQYFALCNYYGMNLVRIGAGDKWGSSIQYDAWANHQSEYFTLLKTMARQAADHGVWICLVMAGTAETDTFTFGGSGSAFDTSSSAYSGYITYVKSTISAVKGEDGIGMFDLWNEPDYDAIYYSYWASHNGKNGINSWEKAVCSATKISGAQPRTMGVAGQGAMFGWGQSDFDLATGKVGWEIASRHYYATATDEYLFADPEAWAENDGIPLYWSELGYNAGNTYVRWTYAESRIFANGGQAITSMVMNPMNNYPYTGGSLLDAQHITPGNGSGGSGAGAIVNSIPNLYNIGAAGEVPYYLMAGGIAVAMIGTYKRRSRVLALGVVLTGFAALMLATKFGILAVSA
ncbi:MAG: hypothetical protein SA339_08360 [Methanomassiliicoccus sp.]|nr:hypothetical protein [Methanomassiliicoccus sp.]